MADMPLMGGFLIVSPDYALHSISDSIGRPESAFATARTMDMHMLDVSIGISSQLDLALILLLLPSAPRSSTV